MEDIIFTIIRLLVTILLFIMLMHIINLIGQNLRLKYQLEEILRRSKKEETIE